MASVVLHAYDQIMEKGAVTLFKSHRPGIADGQQKRDFVYVEDVVNVLHFALDSPIERGVFNLGSGQARSFLDLAQAVFAALQTEESIHFIDTPLSIRDKYQYFTEAPMEKLRSVGFQGTFTSLEAGVSQYVQRLKSKKT
jgi:ADP-L-glycero-D-manno-heptose 6-epimerase